jgi:hypothetical protein
MGCGSATDRGEDLQVRFRLGAQGLPDPLAILVEHPSNAHAAPLKLATPDLLQPPFEVKFQLVHLLGLQALQVGQRALQALLHVVGKDGLPVHHMPTHAGDRLRQRRL